MATRATKKTVVEAQRVEKAHSAHQDTFFADSATFTERMELASGKRKLLAWSLSLVAGLGTCMLGSRLVEMLVLGAFILTGSTFFSLVIYIIGLVMVVYSGMNAFASTMDYVVSSRADQHVEKLQGGLRRINSTVTGWFKRGEIVEVQVAR
jgi:hypothetical protein